MASGFGWPPPVFGQPPIFPQFHGAPHGYPPPPGGFYMTPHCYYAFPPPCNSPHCSASQREASNCSSDESSDSDDTNSQRKSIKGFKHYAAVAYKGEEISVNKFKVLCERKPYKWVKSKNGNVPKGAVPGGVSADGETLYIGRAPHVGSVTIGKISRSKGCLNIPFGNEVHPYKEYEVLVQK